MARILVVEDDGPTRALIRERLEPEHTVIDTERAGEALALALQHKPDVILLDLRLPDGSGFDLCQTFSFLNNLKLTPVFVVTGQPAHECKALCLNLGAWEYFEKPVDFDLLRTRLRSVLISKRSERRKEARIRLSIPLKLKGTNTGGQPFELVTTTIDVSPSGFLCNCSQPIGYDARVSVFLLGRGERLVGRAHRVRSDWQGRPWQRVAFVFREDPTEWIL